MHGAQHMQQLSIRLHQAGFGKDAGSRSRYSIQLWKWFSHGELEAFVTAGQLRSKESTRNYLGSPQHQAADPHKLSSPATKESVFPFSSASQISPGASLWPSLPSPRGRGLENMQLQVPHLHNGEQNVAVHMDSQQSPTARGAAVYLHLTYVTVPHRAGNTIPLQKTKGQRPGRHRSVSGDHSPHLQFSHYSRLRSCISESWRESKEMGEYIQMHA